MKTLKYLSLLIAAAALSGCAPHSTANISALPYSAFTEDDIRSSECRIELGDEVFVSGQGAWFCSNEIVISEGGVYTITGSYSEGGISVSTEDPVKLIFTDAKITNPTGCAVISGPGRLIISSDTDSTLTGSGGEYNTAVSADGEVLFVGGGHLLVEGGVFSKGGIQFGRGVSTFFEMIRMSAGDMISGDLSIN